VRYFLGQAHYRSQLDYHPSALEEAQAALERIEAFQARATKLFDNTIGTDTVPAAFASAMEDDLNVPEALAVLHATVRAGNAAPEGHQETTSASHRALEALVAAQIAARADARAAKDWATADAIRDQLAEAGIVVKDTPDGVTWSVSDQN